MFDLIYILLFRWNKTLGIEIIEASEWSLRGIDLALKDLEEFQRKHVEIIYFQSKEKEWKILVQNA